MSIRPILLGLLVLVGASAPARAQRVCIVDQQIAWANAQLVAMNARIVPKQRQLASMTQTQFSTEAAMQAYEAARAKLESEISELQSEQSLLASLLQFLQEKRALFPAATSVDGIDYFHPTGMNVTQYGEGFRKVTEVFSRLYPNQSLSFQSPPQVMIYPTQEAMARYEKLPGNVQGLMLSQRGAEMRRALLFGPSNAKIYVITIYGPAPIAVFHHEVSHAVLAKILDPSHLSVYSDRPCRPFLNEGFAENVAAALNESVYTERAKELAAAGLRPDARSILTLINSPPSTSTIYAEATVFVRWLSTLPDAFLLLRQLMNCQNGEHESVFRNYQSAHSMTRSDFGEYLPWREAELKRVMQAKDVPPN